MSWLIIATEVTDTTLVTVSLPWMVWTALGGIVLGAFTWLARLCLKALNESRESVKAMHTESVALTREVVASQAQSSAALVALKEALQKDS